MDLETKQQVKLEIMSPEKPFQPPCKWAEHLVFWSYCIPTYTDYDPTLSIFLNDALWDTVFNDNVGEQFIMFQESICSVEMHH